MSTIEVLSQYEAELTDIIGRLQANQVIDLNPLANSWKEFLLSLNKKELSEAENEIFNRCYAHFKKIEDILSEKMSELVMARSITQNQQSQ